MTYTMNVEKAPSDGVKGAVIQHPFHLGTEHRIAVQFVMEQLRAPGVMSVALYRDQRLVKIYDYRDLDT